MLVRPTPHSVSPCLPCSIFTRDTNVVLNLSFYGITGSSGLTHGFVERGRAVHAGKVHGAQRSLVKVYGDRPTPKTPRCCCAVIRETKMAAAN